MIWVFGALILLTITFSAIVKIGSRLPAAYVAERATQFSQTPEAVWKAIRESIDRAEIEQLSERNGRRMWRQRGRGEQWTCELMPSGGGSVLKIKEEGEIRDALSRFLARYVFGQAAAIDKFLRGLGRKFGEEVRFES